MDDKQQDFHDHGLFSNPEGSSSNGYAQNLKHFPLKLVRTRPVFDDHAGNSPPRTALSDCQSGISGTDSEQESRNPCKGLSRVLEGDKIYQIIKKRLESSLSSHGYSSRIENIYRNDFSGIMNRARWLSFGLHAKAMERKCEGNANIKYAWYSASKFEIDNIISFGFGLPKDNVGMHCNGVNLFPVNSPFQSVQSLDSDENGLRHVLLCRVILGKMEAIPPWSRQTNPSSEEFDSGVDDSLYPRRYIVWSSSMNTRILPEFVVSFRTFSYRKEQPRMSQRRPNSDWMPFGALIATLKEILPRAAIDSIEKIHIDYRKQKITRREMVGRLRHIAGDRLLIAAIKSHKNRARLVV